MTARVISPAMLTPDLSVVLNRGSEFVITGVSDREPVIVFLTITQAIELRDALGDLLSLALIGGAT